MTPDSPFWHCSQSPQEFVNNANDWVCMFFNIPQGLVVEAMVNNTMLTDS
jgi:hypothetical protein